MASNDEKRPQRLASVLFGIAVVGNLLNLAGLADGVIKWRDFFRSGLIEPYQAVKSALYSVLPFDVPGWLQDSATTFGLVLFLQVMLFRTGGSYFKFMQAVREQFNWFVGGTYSLFAFGVIPMATNHIIGFMTDPVQHFAQGEAHTVFMLTGPAELGLAAVMMWNFEQMAKGDLRSTMRKKHQLIWRTYAIAVASFIALLFMASDFPRVFR